MAFRCPLFRVVAIVLALAGTASAFPPNGQKPLGLTQSEVKRIYRHLNGNIQGLLAHDQARAARLQARGQSGAGDRNMWPDVYDVPVTNSQDIYTMEAFGKGLYTLLIDTGSSNTWVGANKSYEPSPEAVDLGNFFNVSYGSGNVTGKAWRDTVEIGDLVIKNQSIGVANHSMGFSGVDGIIGVGPVDLTENTVNNTYQVATVMNNLYSQGVICDEVLGVYYAPTCTLDNITNGELSFGGTDRSKYIGAIRYIPLTDTAPASLYWGIDQTISYGSHPILNNTAGIVDTGTTLILLASEAFELYQNLTGGKYDNATGLLRITEDQYENLQSLYFDIRVAKLELTRNAQIWPRALNSAINGTKDTIYLVVNDLGSPLGMGLDFINGYTLLERYYSVFDTTRARLGFAPTTHTFATTN